MKLPLLWTQLYVIVHQYLDAVPAVLHFCMSSRGRIALMLALLDIKSCWYVLKA